MVNIIIGLFNRVMWILYIYITIPELIQTLKLKLHFMCQKSWKTRNYNDKNRKKNLFSKMLYIKYFQ